METSTKVLIIAAVIPGILLAIKVYRADKIEKEPPLLLIKQLVFGAFTVITAIILETLGDKLVNNYLLTYGQNPTLYNFIDAFIVVAVAEEGGKLFMLKKGTWNHAAFNYRFDGIVYAVMTSLGFAIVENLGYSYNYGLSTALIRAVTAVPAHTIFAIFMGHYYSLAKEADRNMETGKCRLYLCLSLIVPVILHGTYDFIAMSDNDSISYFFVAFVIILNIVAWKRLKVYSETDDAM